jgi:hypothetical protein
LHINKKNTVKALLTIIMPSKLDETVIARASAELPPTSCIVEN